MYKQRCLVRSFVAKNERRRDVVSLDDDGRLQLRPTNEEAPP